MHWHKQTYRKYYNGLIVIRISDLDKQACTLLPRTLPIIFLTTLDTAPAAIIYGPVDVVIILMSFSVLALSSWYRRHE